MTALKDPEFRRRIDSFQKIIPVMTACPAGNWFPNENSPFHLGFKKQKQN